MKKHSKKDIEKIKARWIKKYNEFLLLPKDELKRLFNETK